MKYYLDTNIIIYALKNSFPAIKDHFYNIPAQSLVIPTIVLAEIEYGARKSIDYEKTMVAYRAFMNSFDKASFTEKAAKEYGDIRASLEKSGRLIGNNDMLIAAIVRSEKGILVTHNTKEFERINNLQLEDWTIPAI